MVTMSHSGGIGATLAPHGWGKMTSKTGQIWRKVTPVCSPCGDRRRASIAVKTSRIDALWLTMLAYKEDYKEDFLMKSKGVATEKGSRAIICYNTMLILLNPSQIMEKCTIRVEIEASWTKKMCCHDNKGKIPHHWKKSSNSATITQDCCQCCTQ
jgi:hypothetical protein